MTPPPGLQDLIDTVIHDSPGSDALTRLATAAATIAQLEETNDALLEHFVHQCRRDGQSWSQISAALGVTKQAVHKRFAGPLADQLIADRDKTKPITFERFTARARHVLAAAKHESIARGHAEINGGHMLLGLYAAPDGVAARILLGMQITREQIDAALQPAWASTPSRAASAEPPADPPMASDGRLLLRNCLEIALVLGHNYIGTEHMLLAMFRDEQSAAARALAGLGVAESGVKVRMTELMGGFPPGPAG